MNTGGSAGGSAPQRRVHRIHRITSHNILRPFLPSVHIDGGGALVGHDNGGGVGRLFFYFTIRMFERFTLLLFIGLVFQYIPNLSNFLFQTYNLWSGPDPCNLWSSPESESIPPSILTLFASPVYSYGGDATLHTFFMIRPFSLYSNKIETHSSLSYLLHQSCL